MEDCVQVTWSGREPVIVLNDLIFDLDPLELKIYACLKTSARIPSFMALFDSQGIDRADGEAAVDRLTDMGVLQFDDDRLIVTDNEADRRLIKNRR